MRIFLLAFIVFIAVFHITGLSLGWYVSLNGFDIPMHIMGGAWIVAAFWYFVCERTNVISFREKWIAVAVGVGIAALVGVLWEMYEFSADVFVRHSHTLFMEPGWIYFDTLKDLLDDVIGASVAMLVLVQYRWDKLGK